ncbi:MAG: PEP-CTERM system TPR-repeat protein PrsT [Burkholderiales bacterium]|nr:PEP-CTERM system TPR-repeat protein PrsT [Burkholderiales bacterium]
MSPLLRIGQAWAWAVLFVLAACGGQSEEALLSSAKTYLDKGETSAAVVQLKAALQKNGQSGPARLMMGQALLRSGDPAGAVVELERARTLGQADNLVVPLLAEGLASVGQVKAVTERFGQLALPDPEAAAELKTVVGVAYIAQNKLDQGAAEVDAALRLAPKSVRARLMKARLVAGAGNVGDALALVNQVVADAPTRIDALQLKGELQWLGQSDTDAAMQTFRAILAIDPADLGAHTALIGVLQQRKDVAGFKAQLALLKKAWPKHPITQLYEAQLALADGDIKRAREGAQQLLRLSPQNVSVLQLAGAIELQAGALMQAVSHLNKAVQVSPAQPLARQLLADAHLRLGQPEKAVAALQPLLAQPKPSSAVLALAAQAHLQSGDLASSEVYFVQADKASPGDPKLLTALALTEVAKGNPTVGFSRLEAVAASDPSSFADLAIISMRLRRNELADALRAVDRLQGKMADKPLPYLLRGRILLMQRNAEGARAAYEKGHALDPTYFPGVVALATLDVIEKKLPQALKRYEDALAREPRNVTAMLAVADLRLRTGAKPEDVAKLLSDAVKANPAEIGPRLALIDHHLAQRDAKAALVAAQEGMAAVPDNLDMLDALGRAQLFAGDTEQAINSFRKIVAAHPAAPGPQLRLADAYIAKRDYLAASQSLQRVLDADPKHLAAQQAQMRIAMLRKRPDDAIRVARAVQKQRPDEPVGYVLEGEIHARQRAWEPTASAFRAALDRGAASDVAIRLHAVLVKAGRQAEADRFAEGWLRKQATDADFVFHLGLMALERKDLAGAEARFRQTLELKPDNAAANNNIASMLLQQGKPGALPFAERANQLLPNQADIMDTLATALAEDKQYARALELQRKALALAPEASSLRLSFAKLLIRAGDKAAAKAELDKLALLGDKFSAQDEVVALLKGL